MPRRSEYNDGYEGWGDSNFFGNDRKKQTDRHQTFCRKSELHYYPHYTDHYYKEARTIFGEKEDGLSYDYSDRLQQWDFKKSQRAWEFAKDSSETPCSADFYQKYLSAYYDRKIILVHVMAGCNLASGYPYQVFGYKHLLEKSVSKKEKMEKR